MGAISKPSIIQAYRSRNGETRLRIGLRTREGMFFFYIEFISSQNLSLMKTLTFSYSRLCIIALWCLGFFVTSECKAQIPAPSGLYASSLGATSADLAWTPGGTEIYWEFSYGVSPLSSPSSGILSNEFSTYKHLSGLSCNTSYDVYVRSWANGLFSTWTGPYTFTTTTCCTPCNQTNHVDSLLINTGYDIPSSSVIASGSPDPKWTLIAAPSSASLSVPASATSNTNACIPPAAVFPNSHWISSLYGNSYGTTNAFNDPFTFQYDFCLCEDDSVEFNLKAMMDDTMRVYIDAYYYEFATVSMPAAGYNTHNYGITKVFLPKGKHTLNVDLFNTSGTCYGFDLVGKIKSAFLLEHGSCNSSFVFNNPIVVASASSYTLCAGVSTTLNASGASTYVWEPGTLSGSTQTITPSVTTTYTVTGSNAMGCTDTKTVTIVVNPNPVMSVTPYHADCSGSGGFTFLPTSGTAPFDIQINPCPGFPYCTYSGVTSAGMTTTRVYAPGTYTITTTDANGCTSSNTTTVNSAVALGINLIPHQPACCGGNGAFSFSGLNPSYNYTFSISPCPSGAPCTYVTNGISTSFFYPAGNYTITMTDSNGCSTSVTTTLYDPQPCLQATATMPPCTVCIRPTADALLHELLPTTNYGNLNPIRASQHTYSGPWAGTKGLFQFDLSSIPPGSTITNATINLNACTNCAPGYNQHYDLGGGTGNWGVLRRVVTPWTEAGVTWNTAPSTTGSGIVITSSFGTSTLPLVENITTMAQYWLANPAFNYGFELALGDNAQYYHGIIFASRENADTNLQPSLCITYVPPIPQVQMACITASEDALLHEYAPTTNYGSFDNIRASKHTYGGPWAQTKGLFKFDMSSLPANAIITSATMTLSSCYGCTPYYLHYDLGGGTGNAAVVKKVTSPWTEYGVTWNTAPSTTLSGAYTTPNFGDNTATSLVEPGMESMVQNWVTSPATNYGVELSLLDPSEYYHGVFFASRESSIAMYRPKMCIEYVVPSPCNQILCHGGTMLLNIDATGGTPGYNGTGLMTVSAGPYSFTVTDANGCSSTVSGVIYEAPVKESFTYITSCDNSYVWPVTGQTYTSSGIYSQVYTTANGCDSTAYLDLTIHPRVQTFTMVSACGSYTLAQNGITYTSSTQVSYYGGQDVYGCDSLFIVNITILAPPSISVIPFAANCVTGLGAFALMPSGGTAPYTIQVSPCSSACTYVGLGVSTTEIYPVGNYTITVIDANGCVATTVSSIVANPPLSINLITHPPLCGSPNGAFSFSGPIPSQTYTFTISPCPLGATCSYTTTGISTNDDFPPGTYTITISDGSGCTASSIATITNPVVCANTNSLVINTGYDAITNAALASAGLSDPFWTITTVGGAVFSPAVTTTFNPISSSVSRAISNTANENSIGQRICRRIFNTCSNDHIAFDLNLAYDNWINGIYVDGVLVSLPSTITPGIDYHNPANFSFFHNYSFVKYLSAGTHTLDIYTVNEGGPTLLKVEGTLTGTSNSLVTNTSPANCCCASQGLTSTGTIKIFNQGYYTGNGVMSPVLLNQGVSVSALYTDSVLVELRAPSPPFTLEASFRQVITNNGNCYFSFPSTLEGNEYYLVIKHRNSIETWSANPVLLSNQFNYDFTTAATQAYGDNQVEVEQGVYAVYSGDINQDGFVDSFDFPALDTDIFNGVSGVYVNTDLNGDGFVDSFDFPLFDVNSFNGVSVMTP